LTPRRPSTPISSTCEEVEEGSSDYGSTEDTTPCKCTENNNGVVTEIPAQCFCGIDRECFEEIRQKLDVSGEPYLETDRVIERDELVVN
jgi:hypothetical protein